MVSFEGIFFTGGLGLSSVTQTSSDGNYWRKCQAALKPNPFVSTRSGITHFYHYPFIVNRVNSLSTFDSKCYKGPWNAFLTFFGEL